MFFAKLVYLDQVKFNFGGVNISINFALHFMEVVAQSVRASDCGSEGRGFETHHPPSYQKGILQKEYPFIFPRTEHVMLS